MQNTTLQTKQHRWQPLLNMRPQLEGSAAKNGRRLSHLSSDLSQSSVSSALLANHGSGMATTLLSLQSPTASEASAEEGSSRQCTALESTRWGSR